jgi:hypothetical protein
MPLPGKCCVDVAPVAQLDRAPDFESGGQGFESLPARHHPSVTAHEFLLAIFFASRHRRRKQLGSNACSQKKFRLSKWWVSPGYMDRPLPPCRRVSRDPAETQPTKTPNGILKVIDEALVAASRHQTATRALMSAIGKRTSACALHMSAFDPKRTSCAALHLVCPKPLE